MDFVNWTVDGLVTSSLALSDSTIQNIAVQVAMNRNHTAVAHYKTNLCEAVDNCNLIWETGGDSGGWFAQTDDFFFDYDAAQSQNTLDNQSNYLKTTVQGPGNLSFYWKVASGYDFDNLSFYIDGVYQERIRGETAWSQRTYSIGSGTHILRWEYKKDESLSGGMDCGWVDKVEFSGGPFTISGTVTAVSSAEKMMTQAGLGGVVLSGLPGNPQTNSSGQYSALVDYGWSGTVIPSKEGFTFNPTSRTYSNLTSHQTSEDYEATLNCTKLGDVSGDGNITPSDAQLAFEIFLNLVTPNDCQTSKADANCSGSITPQDSQWIFESFLGSRILPDQCAGILSQDYSTNKSEKKERLLRAGEGKTESRGIIVFPIYVNDTKGLKSFGMDLMYPDDKMEFVRVRRSELTQDFIGMNGQALGKCKSNSIFPTAMPSFL